MSNILIQAPCYSIKLMICSWTFSVRHTVRQALRGFDSHYLFSWFHYSQLIMSMWVGLYCHTLYLPIERQALVPYPI